MTASLKPAALFRTPLAGMTISDRSNHGLLRGPFMTDPEGHRDPDSRSGAASWVMFIAPHAKADSGLDEVR